MILLQFFILCISFTCSAQNKKLYKVEIYYVRLNLMTSASVPCEDFINQFYLDDLFKTVSIKKKDDLTKFKKIQRIFIRIKNKNNSIDVRLKINFFYGTPKDCEEKQYNQEGVFNNEKLYDLLKTYLTHEDKQTIEYVQKNRKKE